MLSQLLKSTFSSVKITDLNVVDLPAAGRKIALVAQDQNRDVLLLPVPLNVSPDGVGELNSKC